MIVAILSPDSFPVKAGARRHIDLAAQNRADSRFLCRLIEIYYAVHCPVIRNCERIHSELLCPGDNLPDLAGAIQQRIFCMYMKVCKCHCFLLRF